MKEASMVHLGPYADDLYQAGLLHGNYGLSYQARQCVEWLNVYR